MEVRTADKLQKNKICGFIGIAFAIQELNAKEVTQKGWFTVNRYNLFPKLFPAKYLAIDVYTLLCKMLQGFIHKELNDFEPGISILVVKIGFLDSATYFSSNGNIRHPHIATLTNFGSLLSQDGAEVV